MNAHDRRRRRRQLIALIASATDELTRLEVADQRAEALTRPHATAIRRADAILDPTAENAPAKVIRAWAARNGILVPHTGRIPATVRAAYTEAQLTGANR